MGVLVDLVLRALVKEERDCVKWSLMHACTHFDLYPYTDLWQHEDGTYLLSVSCWKKELFEKHFQTQLEEKKTSQGRTYYESLKPFIIPAELTLYLDSCILKKPEA